MKIKHLIIFIFLNLLIQNITYCFEKLTPSQNEAMLQALNPNAVIYTSKASRVGRAPANFIPDDDIEISPFDNTLWIDSVMVEDDDGVLRSMKTNLRVWEEKEEFVRNWNLESTNLYIYPDQKGKRSYVEKNIIKYLDKRVAGQVKNAEEGSTLYTVGQMRKALRPSTDVGITKKIKVKFKAKVLQREGKIYLINPWFDYHTYANVDSNWNSHLRMNISKQIKMIGVLVMADYDLDTDIWIAQVGKPITNNISAIISSTQTDHQVPFAKAKSNKYGHENDSDIKYQISFTSNF